MSLTIVPSVLPVDQSLPAGVQQLLNLVAGNLTVQGFSSVDGLVVSATEPNPDQRDRVWLKTDVSSGAPIQFRTFNAGAWVVLPTTMGFGPTDTRPVAPAEGEQYFDSDLTTALVYERASWRTLSGSPGDIKFVRATTIASAIESNPGWAEFEEGRGRVFGAAGAGAGLTDRNHLDTAGSENHTLTVGELPSHTHGIGRTPQYANLNNRQSGGSQPGIGSSPPTIITATDTVGGGTAHNIMQPSIFLWALEKQ
tara:strand:+ start:14188 stop:14946 length:759 start_codon:yes stop_codon:yes gene_type:complete